MNRKILRVIHKYSLGIILMMTAVAALGVVKAHYSPMLQFQILIVLTLGYLIWALFHHLWDKSLSLEVMIEYILTAALFIAILYGMLF